MSNIPKVIHYCWFGGTNLSELALKCIESWKKYCPDYEIIEWNEENFDINCNQYVKEAYETKKWAFVTDYVRVFVLNKHGGIYMDTDVEIIKNIDHFLNNEAFAGFEEVNKIQTAIIGACKDNKWIRTILEYYDDKHFIKENGSLDITTNVVIITNITTEKYNLRLDNTFQKVNDHVAFYPKDYFCPKDYITEKIEITENTHAIHHFNASWHTDKERMQHEKHKRYINIFGNKLGKKIYKFNKNLINNVNTFKEKGMFYCIKKLYNKIFSL